MPTHRLVTVHALPKNQWTVEVVKEHGPQFRVPEKDSDLFSLENKDIYLIPACALRDNWVGYFLSDEVIFS